LRRRLDGGLFFVRRNGFSLGRSGKLLLKICICERAMHWFGRSLIPVLAGGFLLPPFEVNADVARNAVREIDHSGSQAETMGL
jgi:hypothetical protein